VRAFSAPKKVLGRTRTGRVAGSALRATDPEAVAGEWRGWSEQVWEEFLKDYWQKKPLLVRNAFPEFECPLGREDLQELSCEEDVESRLIKYEDGQWKKLFGPFDEEQLSQELPAAAPWTLLVNEVNMHMPFVNSWFDPFNFIPSWRFDDMYVSKMPAACNLSKRAYSVRSATQQKAAGLEHTWITTTCF
jgi:hypothetical protein